MGQGLSAEEALATATIAVVEDEEDASAAAV